ncbi:MAG: NAD-dependent protein deacylase [Bacteroidetes bacterium]|nr:NAD-dependent protein deacylase [Bacteroidota bacterium]
MSKKRLVIFSGAGISAESGLKTFRDQGGLWEQYRIEDVATFEAWTNNMPLVIDFYNQRRKQVMEAKPNEAHKFIADLQKDFDVYVITQNIDDLHERAGSKKVIHLHGEIMKVRSSVDEKLVYPLKKSSIQIGELCDKGSQLRPHIVWFGEMVPEMENAYHITEKADLFVVIGTSLNVYPAAGLLNYVNHNTPKWLVDPGEFNLDYIRNLHHIKKTAVSGVEDLKKELAKNL